MNMFIVNSHNNNKLFWCWKVCTMGQCL